MTSPDSRVCKKVVSRYWKELCILFKKRGTKEGGVYVWISVEKAWENIPVQFPIWNTEKRLRNHTGKRKYEGDKEGSGIKTGSLYSCSLIQELRCPEAACWIAVCCIALRGRSFQFCLSKHIQSGPFFLTHCSLSAPKFSPFKLDVWSIVSVVKKKKKKRLAPQGPPKWRVGPVASVSSWEAS